MPYLGITIGFGILLIETRPFWGEWLGIIIFSSLILTGLIVLRQFVAVKENINLLSERAEQQNEFRFRTFFENSTDLIRLLDFEGNGIFRSPSVAKVLGYEEAELDAITPLELVHPDDVEALRSVLYLLEKGEMEQQAKYVYRARCKDGSYRVLEGIAKQISDKNLNLQGVLTNARDITERAEYEANLQLYMEKLEQSNRELQDFAYVASHDLQEPLRKVQAFGDRLNRKYGETLGEEGNDYLKRMRDAAVRMQTLIEGLLEYSRVATKAKPFESTNLNEICREVVSDLEVRIEQTKAEIQVSELPIIDADALQIRQLLQNLISNSLKFQKADASPIVKIYSKTLDSSKSSCQIFIEDNGIGFEEKYLDRIFGVFQRLHGRTEYKGSGIGLSVCKKIVERHGGEITARSKEGKGATFIITLPLKAAQESSL